MARGIAASLSASTVRRWLDADALKPWQYRSWIFIRDPEFQAKAARVLDLYAGTCDGVALGPDEYVISSDEKTSILFSVVQRKVVAPNDFTNLDQVQDRLRAFEDRYNATAQPFKWKFTTTDLEDLLARLDRHRQGRQEESCRPPTA